MTEEEFLAIVDNFICLAFEEEDPYMRDFFQAHLMRTKWVRVAALQGCR
jgi:hypothetical protein